MTEAWRNAMAMVKSNQDVLLAVAGIFFFFPNLAAALLVPGMQAALVNEPDFNQAVAEVYADYWWLVLLITLAQAVGMLTLLALLRDGSEPTVGHAIKAGFAGLVPYFLAYVLFGLGIAILFFLLVGIPAAAGIGVLAALGAIAAILLAIYIVVKISLTAAVVAIEKVRSPVKALRRSWDLTGGSSLRLFVFYALIAMAYLVVSLFIGIILSGLNLVFGPDFGLVLEAIVASLIGAVITVIFVAVLAAVHRQLAEPTPEPVGGIPR